MFWTICKSGVLRTIFDCSTKERDVPNHFFKLPNVSELACCLSRSVPDLGTDGSCSHANCVPQQKQALAPTWFQSGGRRHNLHFTADGLFSQHLSANPRFVRLLVLPRFVRWVYLVVSCSTRTCELKYQFVENISSYTFLRNSRDPHPLGKSSMPMKYMIHNSFIVGERVVQPGADVNVESGYQVRIPTYYLYSKIVFAHYASWLSSIC